MSDSIEELKKKTDNKAKICELKENMIKFLDNSIESKEKQIEHSNEFITESLDYYLELDDKCLLSTIRQIVETESYKLDVEEAMKKEKKIKAKIKKEIEALNKEILE